MPTALVITTAGTNCDLELLHAFSMAGCEVESMHLTRLCREPVHLDRADLIGIPGGFSYGDAVAAGRIAAQLIRQHLYSAFTAAIQRGTPIIAPCNGFQIAAQAGLLPGPAEGEAYPDGPPAPTVALAENANARFVDRWTRVEIPAGTRCIWTRDLQAAQTTMLLPSAHGEGRFVADDAVLGALERDHRIALRYAPDENFNGSAGSIAGICDATGLVFGLMPHPERFTRWLHHPAWTRLSAEEMSGEPIGLQMFRSAVRHVTEPIAV